MLLLLSSLISYSHFAMQVSVDGVGNFMYTAAMLALLVIGGYILAVSYLKYWRYYKKGIMALSSFIPIFGLGLVLFILGLLMLFTW